MKISRGNKIMKLKLISFLLLSTIFISAIGVVAQEKDENGFYIYKKLTENDMKRLFGEEWPPRVFKVNGEMRYRKESIISGNKITTILYNYGSICKPNTLGNVADLVWQGLGYGFEFGPLAAAEVTGKNNSLLQIVSDSFVLQGQGDYNPAGTLKWGWLPKSGFVDTTFGQNEIARLNIADKDGDGKPDSWPDRWYVPETGKYLWPAFLGDQATAPDEEVYYVVDDYTNAEFPYYPFPSDSTKRGLGLDMDVRVLQFNNPLAEDIMFLVYQITNASPKSLDKVYFGMHGDPHVGGPSNYNDDKAGFLDPFGSSLDITNAPQRARNMVYSWDDDMAGDGGRRAGYFGWKFLESPSNHTNLKDDDDDGIRDESPANSAGSFIDGVTIPLITPNISGDLLAKYITIYGEPRERWEGDEDGDWLKEFDDIGIDGIGPDSPNYPGPDFGEGDGKPSQGWFTDVNGNGKLDAEEKGSLQEDKYLGSFWAGSEPNFGFRDISESDQLGLTSFHAATYTNSDPNVPRNDPLMWEWLSSDSLAIDQKFLQDGGDNIFNFGTGPTSLAPGESQRFSMAILFGNDLDQLVLNAESATRILESDYRFAKPPEKPNVRVVAGDGQVTLYWDNASEESFDPFLRTFDFQGYKIYRSQDPSFADAKTVTDGFGNPFIGKGIAQFDVVDSLSGFHPVEFLGRGIKYNMGTNNGLVHEYVDKGVKNGITYYYAVAAYDGGSIEFGLPPSETQTVISKDPLTGELIFDVNTAKAIPMVKTPGLLDATAGIDGTPKTIVGNSTGPITIKVLEPGKVQDKLYSIEFTEPTVYNVLDSTGVSEEFKSKGTVFVDLSHQNLIENTLEVFDKSGAKIDKSRYELKANIGKIKGTTETSLPAGELFTVNYRYYPVYQSSNLVGTDDNPTFDGMRVYVKNEELNLDKKRSGWKDGVVTNVKDSLLWDKSSAKYIGNPHIQYRANWEIRWLGTETNADGSWTNVGDTATSYFNGLKKAVAPFRIYNTSEFDAQGQPLRASYLINETGSKNGGNGRWDWGEPIILQPQKPKTASEVSYYVNFLLKADSIVIKDKRINDTLVVKDTTIVKFTPVLPKNGDIYFVKTSKPFLTGDKFIFETCAAEFKASEAKKELDNIYVVPNPYVVFSDSEQPGRTAEKRGDKQLQFRNLPPQCTVRIYTLTGELVQKIEKDDLGSTAYWDLLSFEGQRVAYGLYIYHVDVPGVGEKIGRLALIK